jgi:hypothetical protein
MLNRVGHGYTDIKRGFLANDDSGLIGYLTIGYQL